ncbi:MAG TPA: hypothetical protein VH330_09410 [Candidatus Udaeobacter sp.]|jgi:hypothetical protein
MNRLTLHVTIWIALVWGVLDAASAYSTGSMNCKDIGDFAAAVVVGKQNGQSMEEALDKVNERTAGYPVERDNLTQIVRAIYTESYAMHFSEEGARSAFTADCEAQAGETGTAKETPAPEQGESFLGNEPIHADANQAREPSPSPGSADDLLHNTVDTSLGSPSPSPSLETAAPDQGSKRLKVKPNEEFRLGDYSYIITNVRLGTQLGTGFRRREKPSEGAKYLFVNYFVRNNQNQVAERPTDDLWIMDSKGRKYLPDKRALAAITPDFAPKELQPGVSHKALTIFELPESVVKSKFGIVVGENGVVGADRKMARIVGSFSSPTRSPSPGAAKSKARADGSTDGKGGRVYPSYPVGAAPAKPKTKSELEAYRRRLEQEWDKEVARREKEEEQITPEQIYLWRRMDRPLGAPFRNFIEDRARYGDPSLGQ